MTISIAAIALCAATATAQERQNVDFEIDYTVINPTWSVYVLGDLPELGGNDITRAVKLAFVAHVWRVTVSLPVNRSYTYQFYERQHISSVIGDPENSEPIGEVINDQTDTVTLWPTTKKMHYHSSFDPPVLHWRQDDGEYQTVSMQENGPGRKPEEFRWLACSFGEAWRPLEFYITNEDETLRDPVDVNETYSTPLDVLFLQDENIFSYVPAPSVSSPQPDYDPHNPPVIESKIISEPRAYRVRLPRGYDDHPDRQYPVIYFNDGLRIWDNIKGFGPPMDLDGAIMAELIRQGKVGEVIMVGANNINTDCEYTITRARDLVPPGDAMTLCSTPVSGEADLWAGFLISELKPLIDAQYRTLPDRDNTFISGFSSGGLNAMYNGWDFTETFGRIGGLSASFWVPNFTSRIISEPWRDIRIYMDSGTVNKEGHYNSNQNVYNNFITKPAQKYKYVVEGDLRYFIAFGQDHQFINAGTRLPNMMTFLYPGTEEPNDALSCRPDLDCNSSVGTSDLLELFAQWGTDGPADFDESGAVSTSDLLNLFANWGPCP